WRDEAAQQRRNPFRVDRELKAGERLLGGAIALARLQLEQPLGIDCDGVGLHRSGGGHGTRNDLALHEQALDARVDEAGAELREVKNSNDQREEPGYVEKDDPARQAREADADKEIPALTQQLGESPALGDKRSCAIELLRLIE